MQMSDVWIQSLLLFALETPHIRPLHLHTLKAYSEPYIKFKCCEILFLRIIYVIVLFGRGPRNVPQDCIKESPDYDTARLPPF